MFLFKQIHYEITSGFIPLLYTHSLFNCFKHNLKNISGKNYVLEKYMMNYHLQ